MAEAQNQGGTPKRRVVVLGGGPAGVAAAFWLTAPEQQNRYQVTLYTQGWRLGGKCASGRNMACSARIEEHGLHLLIGCYENAFATVRACYAAWTPPPASPIQGWQTAFLPQNGVTFMERDGPHGNWALWSFAHLPQWPGEPGDGYGATNVAGAPAADGRALVLRMSDWLEGSAKIQELGQEGADVIRALRTDPVAVDPRNLIAALSTANKSFKQRLEDRLTVDAAELAGAPNTTDRLLILANLAAAMGAGWLGDIVLKGGGEGAYDALNALDFRAWLQKWGATPAATASAPIRAIYDSTFNFPGGNASNINNGSMAAGVTFRFVMEAVFGYRDAPLWKMAAGMGDTVFAPFYQVLEARQPGCVQFFSRLTDMRPGSDGRIAEIDLSVQAGTVGGAPYNPLITVNNLLCWPNQPDWSQLINGSVLEQQGVNFESGFCNVSVGNQTLTVDQDFDIVILAIPPAAIEKTSTSFAQSADWQTALQGSSSVGTQGLQLWVRPTTAGLGWSGQGIETAFAEDYDSGADMSHLLPMESWGGANPPQSIWYFCGCLVVPQAPPPTPKTMQQAATSFANQWMQQDLSTLWPNYPSATIVDRYDIANFDGSDLFVQTPAGTNVASRLSPAATASFTNLYVVGDWTRTRFSGGCLESAIESGMLAARAISGIPPQIKTS
jgi:uncharacterized protein with NAD-binding domain and iron-sulfur cluster